MFPYDAIRLSHTNSFGEGDVQAFVKGLLKCKNLQEIVYDSIVKSILITMHVELIYYRLTDINIEADGLKFFNEGFKCWKNLQVLKYVENTFENFPACILHAYILSIIAQFNIALMETR